MASLSQITKLYQQYMGFTPSSQDISKFSMMSMADVEDILKNSKTDVQSEATNTAQSAINSLMAGMPEMGGSPAVSDYLTSLAEGKKSLEDQYGLTEAEKRMREAEAFYGAVAQKGPMLETTMRGGLGEISPTFLGISRKQLEDKFSGIANPFVKDRMIDSYLNAADRSMTATLNALTGLYQTSLIAAQTAAETERNQYNSIADKVQDLYSDLQWVARERYQEQTIGQSVVDVRNQQEAYAGELLAVQKIGNREDVLNYLNTNSTYLRTVMGDTNYQKLFTEVDRLYPISVSQAKVSKPTVSPTTFKAGQQVGKVVGGVGQEIKTRMAENIGEPLLAISDFFKGLFAR